MLDTEQNVNQMLLRYCHMLIKDVADDRMTEQPLPDVNHPAWILGHLAFSTDRGRSLLGAEKRLPTEWTTLFGPGSKTVVTRSTYPTKGELVLAVDEGFQHLRFAITATADELFAQPSTNPFSKDILPTIKDAIAFLLTGHLGVHLGQLSMWRRMIGLPAMF